jgi:hypothetical protein
MNSQAKTTAILFKVEAALVAASPLRVDQSLVADARAFIALAVEAERATQAAMEHDTEATIDAMHDSAQRAIDAALPLLNKRASSLAGLIAKSAVSLWCSSADLFGEPALEFDQVTDQSAARSIVYDLLRLAA